MATRSVSNGTHGLMGKRKHTGPPLYDLIVSRDGGAPRQSRVQQYDDAVDSGDVGRLGWLNPGRKVAFPVGYAFVTAAVAVALVIAAFVFGHQRGTAQAKAAFDQSLLESSRQADAARQTQDPLMASVTGRYEPAVSQPNGGSRSATRDSRSARPAGVEVGAPNGRTISSHPGPIESDPRVEGAYYYVLATTRRDGAVRLANFCRQRGLEAYVVGGNNGRFAQVIVLPALETSSNSDPLVRRMREQILKIGRLWENSEPGATNLSDAYVQLHTD